MKKNLDKQQLLNLGFIEDTITPKLKIMRLETRNMYSLIIDKVGELRLVDYLESDRDFFEPKIYLIGNNGYKTNYDYPETMADLLNLIITITRDISYGNGIHTIKKQFRDFIGI